MSRFVVGLATCAAAVAALALAGTRTPDAPAAQPAVLVGAGDIASCDRDTDEATAKLLDGIAGTVYTTGDNVYQAGDPAEFAACYDPTWGRHKARTRPAAGNHDYLFPGALGYFNYFGENAGPVNKGYYSYALGSWKIIVLNSNCTELYGPDPDQLDVCGPNSPQGQWLKAELETSPECTLAYFHHPLFTSGAKFPGYAYVKPFWDLLYAYGAEVILNGDDHLYERFAPQSPDGVADSSRGIRQFTVGTGGMQLYQFQPVPYTTSQARGEGVHGVLKFELRPKSYRWQFVPIAGQTYSDSGMAHCHS